MVGRCVVGWPQLHWFVTEHLSKPPKDWLPPPRPSDNAAAYIEVTIDEFYVVPVGNAVTETAVIDGLVSS